MSEAYKQAGVDVEAGYRAVELMKKHIAKTDRKEVIGGVGAFAGLFELGSFSYQEPVLVSGTDGVGTKLKLAFEMNKHDSVGIDLVAMCVNDIVAQGADPLFFLDYIACSKNEPEKIEQIVKGISEGCVEGGCALIGGETAEMPGMYQHGEYDLGGFVVGIAEKSKIITGSEIEPGDAVIGIASSGVHSNGFSLVRKIIEEYQLDLNKVYEPLHQTLGETLLAPTKIYAKAVQSLRGQFTVKGISHITGGGFYENLPRAYPEHLGVTIDTGSWEVPPVYEVLQKHSGLAFQDMLGVFNMGIGMAVIVPEKEAAAAISLLEQQGETAFHIGKVTTEQGVNLRHA
ncbi:phosphoribosylformylglycinamidine cyclo-ligase [Sediminibacillus dalangtanensis]|uniref:Phosphoribosylformylglycinamidine cyclo-ligase n=1 Tax=Sediminibacillus dalangtanensis TaxID=2729421 RepID=A0ABX7VN01_9BACI|nr:phosphoribosylformylglycinamidine cyclo-ligase [Sediminibacillus dalangtanensis]QTM98209.1 phosphoribosylformylglycinamidine cyclo-ligase [Sediminibacillus dalangtanensis]